LFKISPTFWKDVEDPTKTEYVIYGDSIAENEEVLVGIKSQNYQIGLIPFNKLWDELSKIIPTTIQNNKEYLYINDELKVVTYLDNSDDFDLICPSYLMRHNISKNICQLGFTNHQSIKLTYDHSLLAYDSGKKEMVPKSPEDSKYITVINNQIEFNINNLDLYEYLKGLWMANGSVNDKYYLIISMGEKFHFLKWLESNINFKGKIYNKDSDYDFVINDPILKNSLNGVLNKIATQKTIPLNWINNIYSSSFEKFFSFILGYWTGDGSYTSNVISFSSSSFGLLDQIRRIFINFGIYSHIKIDINGRKYNGKIAGDMYILSLISFNINLLKSFDFFKQFKNLNKEFKLTGNGYGNNLQTKTGVIRNPKRFVKNNIKPINIKSKTDIFYSGYVYDFSVPKTENFIVNGFVVHNTDSIHIHSPNEIYTSSKEATDKAELLANEINGVITNLLNNHLLVKMNVNRDYNKTFFKTESVISKMILLEAKKNYAYLEISKKGKIHEAPKVKYVGIPVVRSDYSKFTQDFIKFLVEKIAFNSEIYGQNISDIIISVINNKKQELDNKLKNFDYKYIATPGRWKVSNSYSSTPFTVIGMQLYNTVTNTETFRPGLNGLSFPIKVIDIEKFKESIKPLKASKYFLKNTPLSKINYITLPTNYEIDMVTKIFDNCSIKIDEDIVWDKSFGTVAKNIARVIREHFSNNN